jgi:hypothetical protein
VAGRRGRRQREGGGWISRYCRTYLVDLT